MMMMMMTTRTMMITAPFCCSAIRKRPHEKINVSGNEVKGKCNVCPPSSWTYNIHVLTSISLHADNKIESKEKVIILGRDALRWYCCWFLSFSHRSSNSIGPLLYLGLGTYWKDEILAGRHFHFLLIFSPNNILQFFSIQHLTCCHPFLAIFLLQSYVSKWWNTTNLQM